MTSVTFTKKRRDKPGRRCPSGGAARFFGNLYDYVPNICQSYRRNSLGRLPQRLMNKAERLSLVNYDKFLAILSDTNRMNRDPDAVTVRPGRNEDKKTDKKKQWYCYSNFSFKAVAILLLLCISCFVLDLLNFIINIFFCFAVLQDLLVLLFTTDFGSGNGLSTAIILLHFILSGVSTACADISFK